MTIPVKWTTVPIRELYEGLYDGPHATPKPSSDGPVFLGIKNVTDDGRLDLSDIRNIAESDFVNWTRRIEPQAGDLVFTYEATLNRYAIIPKGFRGCLGRRMALIRPDREKVDVRFLLYYFLADEWRGVIRENTLTGATVDRIPLTKFPNFPVRAPTVLEQKRIAEVLAAYDELIENNRKRIQILEEMARSLYREWFVYFRFPGHGNRSRISSSLGEIPRGWEVCQLGNVADLSWGDTSTTKSSYVTEGYDAYSASGLDGKLDHYDYDHSGVVLSAIGAQCGKTWFARGKWSCIKNTIRFFSIDPRVSNEHLFLATEGQAFWPKRGAAQPFISQGDAEKLLLVVSDPDTAITFNRYIEPMLTEASNLETQCVNLRRTRDLLLPRLLTGQIKLESN